jgi:hypothetical protein
MTSDHLQIQKGLVWLWGEKWVGYYPSVTVYAIRQKLSVS